MTFTTSAVKKAGLWHNLLVVESDTKKDFSSITKEIIEKTQMEDGRFYEVHYQTAGLYKEIKLEEKFYYWFIYNQTFITINGESQELAELKEANAILMGVQNE